MNYKKILNIFKYDFLNHLLLFKYYNKKRTILRNSFQSDHLVKFFFKKSINFEKIRNIFFNKNIFSYSNISEKANIIEYLNQNCSKDIKNYIDHANKIIRKEFSIFEKKYRFKNKINWQYSFFNNFNWKLDKSEKINIYPNNVELDVKYVWEFNRHQFLTYLGFAYYYTNNEKYAKEFKHIILDWIVNNPPLYGINWHSGLEISIRLTSWIFTLYFFKESKEINNNDFFKKIFISMFQHAYYLRYFYSRCLSNHTVGELFGLYLFSKIFEEIKTIKKWERKFFYKFKKQIFLQTRLDGTNIEQSVNYHRFVLEFFTVFVILNSGSINKEEKNLIEKMYDFLLYIVRPNGTFPLIGDFDDGKVLLLTFYKKNPFMDLINLGSILFQRGDLKFISKKISPISILLLGTRGFKLYKILQVQKPINTTKYFKNGGYIMMRNSWSDKANYLFFDFGKFGAQNAGHSHSSITNFIYCYKGKNIINDSGTYTYNKSWKLRNLFRGSKAHNVLTINQKNQAKIKPYFGWENIPKIKRKLEFKDNHIVLICFHDGYNGFLVERKMIIKNYLNNIIIKDSIFKIQNSSKNNMYNIDIFFHFNRDTNIKVENNNVIINNELRFKVSSEQYFNINIEKSYYSPKYGIKYEIFVLNIHLNHSFEKNKIIEVKTEIKHLN